MIRAAVLAALLATPAAAQEAVRFATFNASLNREGAGELRMDLQAMDPQAAQVMEIVRAVDPDVLLVNEFDFDPVAAEVFAAALGYPFHFIAPSNTGVATGVDLNGDGEIGAEGFALANDSHGFGTFEGQYGMLLVSKLPLDVAGARTFREFLWRDLPGARAPVNPDGTPFYSAEAWDVLRLSSKSHWAVPVETAAGPVWVLAAHPTPPVFDGPEDRNGLRNADEIRFLAEIAAAADWPVDDAGIAGGLPAGAAFVAMGDMNADPRDGDSLPGAMDPLLALANTAVTPRSEGGAAAAAQGGANAAHKGDPAEDTADFRDDAPGNLRVDYVLPSAGLAIAEAGVFWPPEGALGADLVGASDHRLVWVDVVLP